MKNIIFTTLLSILCGGAFDHPKTPDVVEKKGLKEAIVEGATIYYEPCLEEKLDVLKKAYSDYRQDMAGNKERQISDPELASKKAAIVDDIYNIVGGNSAELKAKLFEVADNIMGSGSTISPPLVGSGNIIYLMLQSTTKDYLRGGGTLPNLTYDKATDAAQYIIEFHSDADNTSNQEILLPVKSVDEVETTLNQIFGILPQQLKNSQKEIKSSIAIHEISEIGIIGRMRSGDPYKRWFTDGFANAITYEILCRHYSQMDADTFLKGYSTKSYAEIKNQINLQYWMSAEFTFTNNWPIEKEQKYNYARYCFATEEARRIIHEYEVSSVKKILDTYAANGEKKSGALLTAIQRATGDDIQKHMMGYQTFQSKKEGQRRYLNELRQTEKNDIEEKIFVLFRLLDLCEQPFDEDSLNLRKTIASQLYQTGYQEKATQSITEFADFMCESKDSRNHYAGQNLVILYALEINQPDIGLKYAQAMLENQPEDSYALTLLMLKAKKENEIIKAKEFAQKICKIQPNEEDPCHKAAKEVLGGEEGATK